jgi:hypothetical protein
MDIFELTANFLRWIIKADSQAAKRFEQKSEVNDEIRENMQKAVTALKEI